MNLTTQSSNQVITTRTSYLSKIMTIIGHTILRLLPFIILITLLLWVFNSFFPEGFSQVLGTFGKLLKTIANGITYPINYVTNKAKATFPNVTPKLWNTIKTLLTGGLLLFLWKVATKLKVAFKVCAVSKNLWIMIGIVAVSIVISVWDVCTVKNDNIIEDKVAHEVKQSSNNFSVKSKEIEKNTNF